MFSLKNLNFACVYVCGMCVCAGVCLYMYKCDKTKQCYKTMSRIDEISKVNKRKI